MSSQRTPVQHVYSPASGGYVDALCFPYMRDGELINIKYRGPDKTFWQVKGAEPLFPDWTSPSARRR